MKLANSWLILNVGGGPTDDKPTVTLTTQPTLTMPLRSLWMPLPGTTAGTLRGHSPRVTRRRDARAA